MSSSPDAIRTSYRFCDQFSRDAGSNFHMSFLLLPRAKRRAMNALYAFMRHTDDLADSSQPVPQRAEALGEWRATLEGALLGRVEIKPGNLFAAASSPPAAQQIGRAILPALAHTVRQFQIPPEHLRAVIDGVEMDLHKCRYETFDELCHYCQLVASAVGLACVHIWGFRDRKALQPARKCGVALQLTNILRDLREDAQAGRVYLPLEDLHRYDYSVDELIGGTANEQFDRLMEMEVGRAERFFREGAELLPRLEPDGRRIFGMMISTYHALLKRIQRRPRDVLAGRLRLSRPKKLLLAARWAILPPREVGLL